MELLQETIDIDITLYGEQKTISIEPGETILEAANRAKLDPPFSCQSGSCSTCRAKLVRGNVVMDTNDVLSEKELASGYILTCQSRPVSTDILVDYDQ